MSHLWPFLFYKCHADVVTVKVRHLNKFVKPMEVKLRSKISHWPKIPHRYGPHVCLKKVESTKKCLTYTSVLDIIKVIISILLSVNISTIFRISDFEIISKAFFLVKIAAPNRFNFERIATFLYNWKTLRKFFWNQNSLHGLTARSTYEIFLKLLFYFLSEANKNQINLTFQV